MQFRVITFRAALRTSSLHFNLLFCAAQHFTTRRGCHVFSVMAHGGDTDVSIGSMSRGFVHRDGVGPLLQRSQ